MAQELRLNSSEKKIAINGNGDPYYKGYFTLRADNRTAIKLATVDIEEIGVDDLTKDFTFKVRSGSAKIFKNVGVAKGLSGSSKSGSSYSGSSKSGTSSYSGGSIISGSSFVAGTQKTINVAQTSNLSSLKKYITKWKQCRLGGFNKNYGVVIYGSNGYFYMDGIPRYLKDKIVEINRGRYTINDINISSNGGYVVLFGGTGSQCWMAPDALVSALKKYYKEGHKLLSACFNNGEWAVVTDKKFEASSRVKEVMLKASHKYGFINSVFISPAGSIAVCCKNGVYFHNAPHNVVKRVKSCSFIPKFVKFTDDGLCLITDGAKAYNFYL